MTAKYIMNSLLLLTIIVGMCLQALWRLLIGNNIPVVITLPEFIYFAVYSIVLVALHLLFVKVNSTRHSLLNISLTMSALLMIFWVPAIWDTFQYKSNLFLVCSNYLGAITLIINIESIILNEYKELRPPRWT